MPYATRSKTGSLPKSSSQASSSTASKSRTITGKKRQHSPSSNLKAHKRRRRNRNNTKQLLNNKDIKIVSKSKNNDANVKSKETAKEKKKRQAKEKIEKANEFKVSQLRPEIRYDANTLTKEEITQKYCNESDCSQDTDENDTDSDLDAIRESENETDRLIANKHTESEIAENELETNNNSNNSNKLDKEESKFASENDLESNELKDDHDNNEYVCPMCKNKNTNEMIECNVCTHWFHFDTIKCVDPTEKQLNDCNEPFYCPNCIGILKDSNDNNIDSKSNEIIETNNNVNQNSDDIDAMLNEIEQLNNSMMKTIDNAQMQRVSNINISNNSDNNNVNSYNYNNHESNAENASLPAKNSKNAVKNKHKEQKMEANREDSDLSDVDSDFADSSSCPEINQKGVRWNQKEKDRLYNTLKMCIKRGYSKSGAKITGATFTKKNWKDITAESGIKRTKIQIEKKFNNIIQTTSKYGDDSAEHKKWSKIQKHLRNCRAKTTVASGMFCLCLFAVV